MRPLRADDFDGLYAAAADPLTWEQHPQRDRHEEAVFRAYFAEHLGAGESVVVIDRRDGCIIGLSRFHAFDAEHSEVEIGWTFLARSHWGGAYNADLKRVMLDHAFRYVDCVVFRVHPENIRSQRAVEKIGGIRAGLRGDSVLFELRR